MPTGTQAMTPMDNAASIRAILDDAVELKRWRDIEANFGEPLPTKPTENKT